MPRRFILVPLLALSPLTACSGAIEGEPTKPSHDVASEPGGAARAPGPPNPARPANPATPGGMSMTNGAGGSSNTVDPTRPPPAPATDPMQAGALPLRRLSQAEYNNTFRDLFGVTSDLAERFVTEVKGASGYPEGGPIAGPEMARLMETMDALARDAIGGAAVASLYTCDVAKGGEETCGAGFVRTMGRRLFRHPLGMQEQVDLVAVYTDARKTIGHTHNEALRMTLFAMLMSPRFHYHWELGDRAPLRRGDLIALDNFELASRLSYLLWQSTPDEDLLAAAERGDLSIPAKLTAQARRLIEDPKRGARSARGFIDAWMGLEELDNHAAGGDAAMYRALRESTLLMGEEMVRGKDADRTFVALLTSPDVFVNEPLAKITGLDAVKGLEFRKMPAPMGRRVGILTQPGFLAAQYNSALSTPVRRGRFIFERLAACAQLPPLAGEIPKPPDKGAMDSVRVHLTKTTAAGPCQGCHGRMNPYGFVLGNYDRLGVYKDKDDYGQPVDTRADLPDVGGSQIAVAGPADLARAISTSAGARACFVKQMAQYATNRVIDGLEHPLVKTLDAQLATKDDLRELFVLATSQTAFSYRTAAKDEVLQ